jgi:hypothetical protein
LGIGYHVEMDENPYRAPETDDGESTWTTAVIEYLTASGGLIAGAAIAGTAVASLWWVFGLTFAR